LRIKEQDNMLTLQEHDDGGDDDDHFTDVAKVLTIRFQITFEQSTTILVRSLKGPR